MADSHQVRRIIRILQLLSNGRRSSSVELAEAVAGSIDGKEVTIRQIQRDLRAIEAGGVPLEQHRDGREIRWSIPAAYRSMAPLDVSRHELLALHLLKGMLQSFHDTRVATDIDRLKKKIERIAPGRVFIEADLVSDVSPGRYATAVSDDALERIISAIIDPRWDRVTYRSIHGGTTKTFVVSFCRLIDHAGRLYVAAWHPKHQHYLTLAADRIDHVEVAEDVTDPLHTFDERRYRSGRFGVFDGNVQHVRIRIDASAADFFRSRMWHPTQDIKQHRNGDLDLYLHAPLSPELVSWVVGWADVMTVRSPRALIDACKRKVAAVQTW